ncbi:MAG: hypothetical protein JXK94_11415 [Deltaproteobacteria bacterium]|nr:hypothetical protein [Deltaproteobacteria bacterium]
MRGNHAANRLVRKECSALEPSFEEVYIDGFGRMTVCRYCGNAIEVGHASSCPMCQRKQH